MTASGFPQSLFPSRQTKISAARTPQYGVGSNSTEALVLGNGGSTNVFLEIEQHDPKSMKQKHSNSLAVTLSVIGCIFDSHPAALKSEVPIILLVCG